MDQRRREMPATIQAVKIGRTGTTQDRGYFERVRKSTHKTVGRGPRGFCTGAATLPDKE